MASRVMGTIVVLLEGFAPDEKVREFSDGLQSSNLEIITCSPGNLEAALKKLNDSPLFKGKSISKVT